MSRTKNSVTNIIISGLTQMFLILFQFVSRKVFVYFLGMEYLGVNGVFTEILSVLSLAELGVGTAITYALYKPIAEDDKAKIKSLMRLFRKIYMGVGMILFAGGFIAIPFLKFFVDVEIPYLAIYFILFISDSAISYFYSYKQILISANQKNYIVLLYTSLAKVVQIGLQIVLLIWTKSFMLYLLIQLFCGILRNILISRKADRMYLFLKEPDIDELEKEDKEDLKKNIYGLMLVKFGNTVISSTDNLIISSIVGIVAVGVYSNYTMVLNAVHRFVKLFFASITSSVGNYCVKEDKENKEKLFYQLFYYNFLLIGFCSICFYNLLNPFIEWWLGIDFCLSQTVVAIIVIKTYLQWMQTSALLFRDAEGLYWNNRFKVIAEAIINLVASIVLAKRFGIAGVLGGTIISTVLVSAWVEPMIVFKDGMKIHSWKRKYFSKYFLYLALTALGCTLANRMCEYVFKEVSLWSLFGRLAISAVVGVVIFLSTTIKSQQGKESILMLKRIMRSF